jgi:hypothetical protein
MATARPSRAIIDDVLEKKLTVATLRQMGKDAAEREAFRLACAEWAFFVSWLLAGIVGWFV